MTIHFPFSAIVGQDDMKSAMLLTAIDPKIGGVLVFGDRGRIAASHHGDTGVPHQCRKSSGLPRLGIVRDIYF